MDTAQRSPKPLSTNNLSVTIEIVMLVSARLQGLLRFPKQTPLLAIMIKCGIFVDGDNIAGNGGYGIDYLRLREFAESHGVLLRANAYFSLDEVAEEHPEVKRKRSEFRRVLRSFGYHVSTKPIKRYAQEDGSIMVKANVDLEIAVDIMLQAQNLDYILLATGDGDFVRVINAVQDMGRRIEVLGFRNVSGRLMEEADAFHNGYFIPGLLSVDAGRHIGYMHRAVAEKGFGFLTYRTGFGRADVRDDIFVHMSDVENMTSNVAFGKLVGSTNPVEFSLDTTQDGRLKAVNVHPVHD